METLCLCCVTSYIDVDVDVGADDESEIVCIFSSIVDFKLCWVCRYENGGVAENSSDMEEGALEVGMDKLNGLISDVSLWGWIFECDSEYLV